MARAARMQVERIDVVLTKTFDQAIVAFERKVPAADTAKLLQLVASGASAAEVERAVRSMTGDLGFMHLAKVDQGQLVSLLGRRKRITVYLLGNPVLANKMFDHRPEVGLYAPLRACIYEDYGGSCHFTYDLPSALLRQFDSSDIRSVAHILDEKMAELADFLTT